MDIALVVITFFIAVFSASSFGYYLGHIKGYNEGLLYSEVWSEAYAEGWDAAEADIRLHEFYKSFSPKETSIFDEPFDPTF